MSDMNNPNGYDLDYIPNWFFADSMKMPRKIDNPNDYKIIAHKFPCDNPNLFYNIDTWRKCHAITNKLDKIIFQIGTKHKHIPTNNAEAKKWIDMLKSHKLYEIPVVYPYQLGMIIFRNAFCRFYLTREHYIVTPYFSYHKMHDMLMDVLRTGNIDPYLCKIPISAIHFGWKDVLPFSFDTFDMDLLHNESYEIVTDIIAKYIPINELDHSYKTIQFMQKNMVK